jgi:hypothetical protein
MSGMDPDWYTEVVDALAVEDTWFHGDGEVPWDDPRAGDLHERHATRQLLSSMTSDD